MTETLEQKLKRFAAAGLPPASLLKLAGVSIREIAERAGVSYATAWLVANRGTIIGPVSKRAADAIDEALGLPLEWKEED